MLRLAFRAAILDGGVYQEIRDRQETAFSALGVVLVAGIAFGMGMWGRTQDAAQQGFRIEESLNLLLYISTIFTSWVIWTVFVWLLASRLFAGREGYRGSLRALGVCYIPMGLGILVGAPVIGNALLMVGAIWTLVAGVVAVKNIHDFEWWKAGPAATIGWFWAFIVMPWFLGIPPFGSGMPA